MDFRIILMAGLTPVGRGRKATINLGENIDNQMK
jgi:hypothetical protein